jgi:Flp pilus assembly protein TadG
VTWPNRRRQRGHRAQSLVELAILLPVMLLLFIGAYTASNFINDRQVAGQATRAGARLGAEIGNSNYSSGQAAAGCQSTGKDPCIVDQEIVRSTTTISRGLSNVPTISEIDIYEPCTASGSTCTSTSSTCPSTQTADGAYLSGDLLDKYVPNGSGGWMLSGTAQYTLDLRAQTHPNEGAIGVRIVYTFQGSAPMTFFNMQTSEYATMCFAPLQSGG